MTASYKNRARGIFVIAVALSVTASTLGPADVAYASINPTPVTPVFPSEDLVVASVVATAAPFSADPTGVGDSTAAIQAAIDATYAAGGGTVWLPEGNYLVTGSIQVKNHVTLRGDRRDPNSGTGSYGTVVLADVPSGGELDAGLFRIWGSAGVKGLTVYYPDQSISNPIPYPYTFEVLGTLLGADGYMSASIQNVTMLNSFRGISAGARAVHELLYVRNVVGTVLNTGVYLQDSADVDKVEQLRLSNEYWAELDPSLSASRPGRAAIDSYTRAFGTGLKFGGIEWTQFTDLFIADYAVGIDTVPGRRIGSTVMFTNLDIERANIGMRLDYLDRRVGVVVNDARIAANQGTNPKAVQVKDNSGASVIFQSSVIGGGAVVGAEVIGADLVGFFNTTFDSWTGTEAIAANWGSIVAENVTFGQPITSTQNAIRLIQNVSSAALLNLNYTGSSSDVLNNTSAAVIERNDSGSVLAAVPWTTAYLERPNRPGPTRTSFVDASAPPYSATPNDSSDDTAAIQAALSSLTVPGGTVYLPAGIYRVDGSLSVPAGVELRGADDVPHRAQLAGGGVSTGTVIYAYGGRNTPTPDTATPLITLNGTVSKGGGGVRGISVHYPEQGTSSASAIVPYPWTIRGNGPGGVYVMDVAFTNAYRGVDFATNNTDNHFVEQVVGTVLKEGVRVGNASRGWVQNNLFNITGWARTGGMPGSLDETTNMFPVAATYTRANLKAYVATTGAKDQWFRSNFVYGANTGFTVESNAKIRAFSVAADGSTNTLTVTSTGTGGAMFTNIEGCGCNLNGTGLKFGGGSTQVFNALTMLPYSRAIEVTGGTVGLQGAAIDSGNGLVSGGTLTANGVYMRSNTVHFTIQSGGAATLTGNVGGGSSYQTVYDAGSAGVATFNVRR